MGPGILHAVLPVRLVLRAEGFGRLLLSGTPGTGSSSSHRLLAGGLGQ